MSGGVGPSSEITLAEEELHESDATTTKPGQKATAKPPARLSVLSFRHISSLAVAIVLASTGMVSPEDIAFVLFSIFYMYYLSKVAFPRTSARTEPPVFGDNKVLLYYVVFAAVIGLLVPMAYILEGFLTGDNKGSQAAAPHLFLLASQVFMEGTAFSDHFSLPIRVYVPVFYNSKRIFTIVEWLRFEFLTRGVEDDARDWRRVYFGQALVVANLALWSFNLFGFLLPVFLPKAFNIYYSSSRKVKD